MAGLCDNNNNSGTKQNNKKKKRGGSKRKMTAEQTSAFKSVTEWVYLDHPSSSSSSSSSSWIVDDFEVQKSLGLGMEKMVFELHSHTKHSDGFLSPSKLVERAHGNGVSLDSLNFTWKSCEQNKKEIAKRDNEIKLLEAIVRTLGGASTNLQ